MEKLVQLKNKLLKFLPRQPIASMTFQIQTPTMSPSRTPSRSRMVSIIPKEARRRKLRSSSFSAREPTSPKVSCIGEVKYFNNKKKKKKAMKKSVSHKHNKASTEDGPEIKGNYKKEKVKVSLWIFKGGLNIGEFDETETSPNKSGAGKKDLEERQEAPPRDDDDDIVVQSVVPSLGTMKKFASGRGTLSDSDVDQLLCTTVTTNVTPSD